MLKGKIYHSFVIDTVERLE